MRKLLFGVALLLTCAVFAGCLEAKLVPTQPPAVTAPWTAPESFQYVLLDRDNGDEVGRGTLEVAEKSAGYELSQKFRDGEDHDNSSIVVSKSTLKPISGTRDRLVNGERKRLRSQYDATENVVTIIEIKDGGERPIPHRLKSDYYDNDSSLFLWRSLHFAEGLTETYHTVVTGSGEQPILRLEVIGKERVTVPAGTFDTWRLEIRSQDHKQIAWYADTATHPLIQYDNGVQLFQLVNAPAS